MSFLKKSLKALGFSDDEEAETHVYTAKDITDGTSDHAASSQEKTAEHPAVEKKELPHSELPDSLLERVVDLVNASLPEFVRSCIDHESEKRYIYEHLGDSFKSYIAELGENARHSSEQAVAEARQKLENDMAALRKKASELEEQKTEIKNAQLSAERQKRALSEKVHDLDNRIATLEAEKEQYELENKSLVNKLKVSGVKQQELDDALAENTRLLGVIQELKALPNAEKDSEIERLKTELENITAQKDETAEAAEKLTAENSRLQTALTEKEQALQERDGLFSELQSQYDCLKQLQAEQENIASESEQAKTELLQEKETTAMLNEKLEVLVAADMERSEKIGTLENQLEESRNRCAELESSLTELRESERACRAEADESAAKLADATNRCAELQQGHDALLEQTESYKKQIQEQTAKIEETDRQLNEATARIAAAQTENGERQQLSDELQKAHLDLQQSNKRIAELTHETEELQRAVALMEKVEAKVEKYELLQAEKQKAEEENDALRTRVNTLQNEMDELRRQPADTPADAAGSDEELQKANDMIAALKKQRQELISQTASLRTQNKTFENQIASLENRLKTLSEKNENSISFAQDDSADDSQDESFENCINWMMPVLPDSLEEEARRKEEEEARRKEEEEQARMVEKERRAAKDELSSQMSLW